MKKFLRYLFLFIFGMGTAQNVGINTSTPQATLDVVGLPSDATKNDGIIAPRITLTQLTAKTGYTTSQTGAIVYVTNITGTTTTSTLLVTEIGYYYFDGTIWKPLEQTKSSSIFTASLGSGAGGTTNATLAASSFLTVPLSTVTKNVGGGVWNTTNNTYSVPFSGTYIIKSSVRLVDGSSARNVYQAVNTTNTDIPDGLWQTNNGTRWTMLFVRIAYFTKGDLLRLYVYSDGVAANISDASLNVALLSTN